jgi:hypothetical protein
MQKRSSDVRPGAVICPFGRYLDITRASGIVACGAEMKFHQWSAATADQVWQ